MNDCRILVDPTTGMKITNSIGNVIENTRKSGEGFSDTIVIPANGTAAHDPTNIDSGNLTQVWSFIDTQAKERQGRANYLVWHRTAPNDRLGRTTPRGIGKSRN